MAVRIKGVFIACGVKVHSLSTCLLLLRMPVEDLIDLVTHVMDGVSEVFWGQ